MEYKEKLPVGYRWFDTEQIEPLSPFGHGLFYTSFEYSGLKLVEGHISQGPLLPVEFYVANTGAREGAEVAQLYVQDPQSSRPRPMKELKGFRKVLLKPGEKQRVSIPLDNGAFAFYDPQRKGWLAEEGEFRILVGGSSRDIRLNGAFHLPKTILQ